MLESCRLEISQKAAYRLTLQWEEGGQIRTEKIYSEDSAKFPGDIRTGRDEQECDAFFSKAQTNISRLHVEIFSSQQTPSTLGNP